MNERIKEFIEQSGAGDVTPPGFHKYLAKFAELILNDVFQTIDNTGKKWEPDDLILLIKNRFGVK